MAEPTNTRSDISPEMSIPQASLESILCTEELQRRPSRPPDYEKENCALVKLVSALADSPSTIFQTLAETIQAITQCDSAGLSLLTRDGKTPDACGQRFYWPAIAGMWNPHVGGGTPRNFGPCGDVLDRNRTLLFRHFERRYPYLMPVIPAAEECLLVPFYVAGQAVGTIWAIMHSDRRKFDAEDDRVMASLGKFASSAYQALMHIEDLKFQVSQREKAEAEVRELARGLEAKIRRLVGANIIGIFTWNLEGRIIDANDAFLRMVGYDRQELVSGRMRWTDLTPPEWRDRDEQVWVPKLKTAGILHPFEKEYFRKDGSRVPVLIGVASFEDSGNEGVAFVLDLSEQKCAEDALRRSEAYLTEAQRLSQTGSFGCRLSTGEMFWSEETFRIYGYDQSTKPTVERVLQRVHPEDKPLIQGHMDRASREGKACDVECRLLLPDDSVKHVRIVAHAAKNESGIQEFIGAVMDVTAAKQAEEKLRRSEAYLAEAQRLTHTGSWVWQVAGGDALYLSEEWYRIYGFDPAERMPGWEKRLQRVHPEDRARWQGAIERAIGEKSDYEMEYRILLPDGTVKYIHVVGHPVLDSSGDLLQFVGCSTDITARKRAEEALRRSEQRWQTAFENSAIGMMMRDCSDRFIASNRVFQNMLGYTESELSQLSNEEVTYDEDRRANLELIRELLKGRRQHFQIEKRYRRKDGTLLWVRNNVALIPGIADAAPFLFAVVEDITQRKQEESARRYSEERYRIVVETASDAVVSIDESSTILFVNPATSRIFGYDASELIGQPLTTLMPNYMRELHTAGFKRYLDTAERHINWQATELIALRKNSEEFPVEVSFGELAINGRRLFTGFIRDITERKRAEEKIRQNEKELRQLLDFTPQHVTVLGPDGSRLYLNQAGLDYYGLTLEEWRAYDARRFFHPDDLERITSGASKFLSGSPCEIEARLRRKDGKYRWFLIRRNPLRDEQGRITRWYAAATDIDDRKMAEERLQHENVVLREEIDKASMFEEIVGISPALQTVLSRVSKVAPTDSTVLITGETGTGKELVARAIHRRSHRFSRAFVSVNCTAIPRDLIASELFGHEKGAFTGATQRRLGRFELAEGGTIFLDEVGELPAETQIALLRVLQEHEFGRVGGTGSIRTNVRVIAATNRDLEAAIAAGTFRSDLFYRLNVFPIEVPPLRERKEDIRLLVEYFIDRYASKAGKSIRGVNKKSLELLQSYPWPGNIRELQNVIERSVIVCDTENFSVDESWLSRQPLASEPKTQLELARKPAAKEKEIIEAALRESGGRVYGPSGAASKLGIPRSTLESKIRSLKISKSHFKAIDSSKNS